MEIAGLLLFVSVLGAAAATPGPDIAAIIARAVSGGFRGTLPLIGGIICGHVGWLMLALSGLAAVAAMLGPWFLVIKIAAAGYLVFLAWQLWRAPVDDAGLAARGGTGSAFASGLLVSLSNPKAMVFFSAVLPSVIDLSVLTRADALLGPNQPIERTRGSRLPAARFAASRA